MLGVQTNIYYHLVPKHYSPSEKRPILGSMQIIAGIGSTMGIYLVGFVFDFMGPVIGGRVACFCYFLLCNGFVYGL